MPRLIDLDQRVIVPIHDERYDTTYEVQMTVAEIFDKFLDGNKPEVVDAIPVKELKRIRKCDSLTLDDVETIDWLLSWWQKEQETLL